METRISVWRFCKCLLRTRLVVRAFLLVAVFTAAIGFVFFSNSITETRSLRFDLEKNDVIDSEDNAKVTTHIRRYSDKQKLGNDVIFDAEGNDIHKTTNSPRHRDVKHGDKIIVKRILNWSVGLQEVTRQVPRLVLITSSTKPPRNQNLVESGGCLSGTYNRPPLNLEETFEWHPLGEGFGKSYVLSAFYDPRSNPGVVFIIGISDGESYTPLTCFCRVWYQNEPHPDLDPAQRRLTFDSHGRRYHESYYMCKLSRSNSIPYAVSLVTYKCEHVDKSLKVLLIDNTRPPEVNFTVCVSPLNRNYDSYHQLVEMIEVNRMFGAQRFFFYNYSTGSNVNRYIKSYEDEKIINVIPWKIPVTVEETMSAGQTNTDIHYYGQVGALNDCLYRNMFRSRFIVFTDLDEFIVPRQHHTWMELLQSLRNDNSRIIGSYIFRNTFFRSDWKNDSLSVNNSLVSKLRLKTLMTTRREDYSWPWFQRSKCIVSPETAIWVGVHWVFDSIQQPRVEFVGVTADQALLHHYRPDMWKDDPNNPPVRVTDRYMHRFSDRIISGTFKRHKFVQSNYIA